MRRRFERWLPWIALIVVIVGMGNFVWFLAESSALGGDALNGYVRDGHYFVISHGTATEVSQAQWEGSRAHAVGTIGTHLLGIAGFAYLMLRVVLPITLRERDPR